MRRDAPYPSTPFRLLHVFGTFDHGGAEGRTLRLMAALRLGLEQRVLVGDPRAMGARAAAEAIKGVNFNDDDSPLVLGIPALTRLRRLATAMCDYDLVLTYGWGAMDGVVAHRLFSKALSLPPLIHHDDGFSEAEGFMRTTYRRFGLRGCHALVVPSRTLEQIALERWNVEPERVVRIANGVCVDGCRAPRTPSPFPGLEGETRFVVGTVAGLRPEKNLRRLVRAVAAAGPDIVLAIAGEGPERSVITEEAQTCGMEGRLVMPGFLPSPCEFLASFDLFALSSDTEQFPISLAEAMAAGLPIVATDVGDSKEMVCAANQPYVVPARDDAALAAAIRRLMVDPTLRLKIGEANKIKAQVEFNESSMIQAFSDLYRGAMERA